MAAPSLVCLGEGRIYHMGLCVSRRDEDEHEEGCQNTVGFTPHICKGNHDEPCPTTYSPDDPTLQDYWSRRRRGTQTTAGRSGQLARRQHGLCPVCHQALDNGEELHVHHVKPKHHG